MWKAKATALWCCLALGGPAVVLSEDTTAANEPVEHIYAVHDGTELKAYVFFPREAAGRGAHDAAAGNVEGAAVNGAIPNPRRRSAILLFHGGGWDTGSPEWGFGLARHFSDIGMVAVAVQYRLSDRAHGTVTPIEAMRDARAAVRWARSRSGMLGVAPDRIAAYGWSAGAHLAVSTATFVEADEGEEVSCAPDALVLASPALSLESDDWAKKLLGDRGDIADISPDRNVRPGMPPTLLLQGRTDTVTPLEGTQAFHEAMLEAGNECEMIVYDGVGHLFTPAGQPDDGWPKPDPEVAARAGRARDEFLRAHGF